MTSVTLLGPPFTKADLVSMPDDGRRYELVDGSLVVSPAPSRRHQVVQMHLVAAFLATCPGHLRVQVAPVDVDLAVDSVVQPDLLVVDRVEYADEDRWVRPLLALEILSPSTRLIDLTLKKARLEQAGCPAYCVVDPDVPSVTLWQLRDGSYVETAHAVGEEACVLHAPYEVRLVPADLVR